MAGALHIQRAVSTLPTIDQRRSRKSAT